MIQPTPVFGSVVYLQSLSYTPRLSKARMPRIARTACEWRLSITSTIRSLSQLGQQLQGPTVVLVDQFLYHMRPVHLRATLSDLDSAPSVQRCKQHEQAAHSSCARIRSRMPPISRALRARHSRLLDLLFARLIHAHQNLIPIVRRVGRPPVRLPSRTQTPRSDRAGCTNSASATASVRFFLSAWRTVSVLMVPTISHSTNWSANSFRVQLARPSGGSPQAIAINRASRM